MEVYYDVSTEGGVYICERCSKLQNDTQLVKSDNNDYINMGLPEMKGLVNKTRKLDFYKGLPGGYKGPTDILMLCNECNSGVPTGYDGMVVTDNERDVAGFSKYGYVTLADQDPDIVMINHNERFGASLVGKVKFDEYMNKRKDGKKAIATLNTASAVFGHDSIEAMTRELFGNGGSRFIDQSPKEKNRKLILAQYKRDLKAAKKSGDKELASQIQDIINTIKNEE